MYCSPVRRAGVGIGIQQMATAFQMPRCFAENVCRSPKVGVAWLFRTKEGSKSYWRWCPSSLAKLVNISPITIWFMADITIVFMGFIKPLLTGGHHPVVLLDFDF